MIDTETAPDKEFMTTLAKGLAVIELFGKQRSALTISQAATGAGVSRATARRILLTLERLGYVEQRGRDFALAPAALNLGFAYLSSQSWIERARAPMQALSERFGEAAALAILDGGNIVYVARVQGRSLMSNALGIGARLPAFHTALGRVLLGALDEDALWMLLRPLALAPMTPATITDKQSLAERIREDARQGFSIVDEELERGLRAIAAPVRDRSGRIAAALNISTQAARMTRNEMREKFLPALREAAAEIGEGVV